jgi:sugar-specific transcriptional regulator TrmB
MSQDSDGARSVAIEQLEALGLSAYAARTFVALASLGEGTAQDVTGVSEVPRTRVYDAAEELRREGLVDVKQATPKRFWAISTETTGRHFEQEYAHRVDVLTEALSKVETTARTSEQRGVWTVTGRETIRERVVDFVETAEEDVVYMTVGELLSGEVPGALRRAGERGVTIRLAEMSDTVDAEIREAVPGAEYVESLWAFEDTPAGRLLMVDDEKTLVSVLVPDDDGSREETAIWGSGETNSLVVVLRALFAWQLDDERHRT